MKTKIFFTTLLIFSLNYLNAQLNKEKLNQYFDLLEKNNKFNGSVALSENEKIIYERNLGFADYEKQQKNNSETKFRIGSITKTFTSALVLKAIEEGKLDINQNIDAFFPELKNSKKITITQLLNHHSGIHNFTSEEDYFNYYTQPKTGKELMDLITSYESDFEPGSKGEYSNSNYVLLTFILEKIYQKSYSEILTEKIIQPLGLKNTRFGGKMNSQNNEAHSYKFQTNWIKQPETDMSIPLGAGAIISTPGDIIKFGESLFSGKIISMKSLEKMKTLQNGYGLGIFDFNINGNVGFGHDGGIDDFTSSWGYIPETKLSAAVTSNGNIWDSQKIAFTLLNAASGVDYDLPNFTTVEISVEDLKPLIGTYYNSDIQMEISVTEKEGKLYAQAKDQSSFPVDAYSKNEFRFEMAGIIMIFADDKNSFTLKQGGGEFLFTRK